MTAATAHATPYAPRAHARVGRRLERLAVVLGICLPIPLFAVTGLSLPLPSVVERIAAGLVPWANAATLDASRADGKSGSIIGLPSERSQLGSPRRRAVAVGRRTARGAHAPASARYGGQRPASERPGNRTVPGPGASSSQATEPVSTPSSAAGSTPPAPRSEAPASTTPVAETAPPAPPPPPPPPPVEQPKPDPVRDTVTPVVDHVTQPVSQIVNHPDPGAVTGAVGGLVPGGK